MMLTPIHTDTLRTYSMSRVYRTILPFLIVTLWLTACGGQTTPSAPVESTTVPATSAPAPTEASDPSTDNDDTESSTTDTPEGFPLTITDGEGRDLTFEQPPQRIVCLLNRCAQELAFIGVKPVAVGAPYTYNVALDPINFGAEAESFGQINQDPEIDWEAVASYRPDLIIGETFMADAAAEIAPLYALSFDSSVFATVEGFTQDVRKYGQIFGKSSEVEAKIEAVIERAEDYIALSPNDKSALVISFGDESGSTIWIPADCGLFLKEMVQCGNTGSDDWIEGSIETLLTLDPTVLIVEDYGVGEGELLEQLIQNDPLWQELTAVKNDQVHLVPVSQARINTIQSVRGTIDTLMPLLYPEVFPTALTDEQVAAEAGE
jgi:iron complex transport system substrate-binding protein